MAGPCVIGGAGSFVLPVFGWDDFPAAVKRKMVLEIAALPQTAPPAEKVTKAQYKAPYDCLIGEKKWERNRGYWQIP